MIFLEVIAWFGLLALVGTYLLWGTAFAKKFPHLRFFVGIAITFIIPALVACKTIFESNMAQAIVFFSLVVVFYYMNKCIAESANEEIEGDRKLNQK